MSAIGLSKLTLEIFTECPRCFWLAKVKKIERPRSPMPSILNAIDAQMKLLVARHLMDQETVPYLRGGTLVPFADRAKIELFRSWRTFQREVEVDGLSIKAWGELDDLLVDEATGVVTPWDFKSKGDAPDLEYCQKYNTTQGDMYHFLLEGQNLSCSGLAKFTYVWPELDATGEIVFLHKNIDMDTDPARAVKVLHQAVLCLQGKMPPAALDCKVCSYIEKRKELKA